MAYQYKLTRQVEFADTDMAGIMHFSNFFRFMEAAEHAFFRSVGLSVHGVVDGMTVGWPRVGARCDYFKPLRFEDVVEIHMTVREKRAKSLRCDYAFWKIGEGQPVEVARGELTLVCAQLDEVNHTFKAIAIPPTIDALIDQAPPPELVGK